MILVDPLAINTDVSCQGAAAESSGAQAVVPSGLSESSLKLPVSVLQNWTERLIVKSYVGGETSNLVSQKS